MPDQPPVFLVNLLKHHEGPPPTERPHVTLTFAQSIDAKIAGAGGRQLILSGKESMVMTHWTDYEMSKDRMRTMHDGILVGIGTALNDDPQLNVRHLPPPSGSDHHHLPRPIIVDTHLGLLPTCKLLANFQNGTGRRPWVVCSSIAPEGDRDKQERKEMLEEAGAKIIELLPPPSSPPGYLAIPLILKALRDLGIRSLMVEGGARIIASFLSEPVVDALVVTIAPVLVGNAGVGYQSPTVLSSEGELKARFKDVHMESFGKDTVVALQALP
ncbi:hypothetical protein NLJ89_g10456 [Agrocybe chaxingu]|uniref:2,5-diamino-6-ribosylamino-4(3H)-pyrimidinone 5'-phosphate reductase n=1 Tax=Agrocybe chaxingu TaxID=84603 RepID=A0A9W8JR47_9AGAR|nr:hypothetical protein NLJ89_g10456 [Agrocybe chaxingu]